MVEGPSLFLGWMALGAGDFFVAGNALGMKDGVFCKPFHLL